MEALKRNKMFLSVPEAATALAVSSPTVRRWIREGNLAAVQVAGDHGAFRVPVSELQRLAEGKL